MASLTGFIAANAARPLVINPVVTNVVEAASAIVLEHMRFVIAAAVENSARPTRLILVKFAVKLVFPLVFSVLLFYTKDYNYEIEPSSSLYVYKDTYIFCLTLYILLNNLVCIQHID